MTLAVNWQLGGGKPLRLVLKRVIMNSVLAILREL